MTDRQFYIFVGVGLVVGYWLMKKAGAAAGDVVEAVTPTNPNNIFYRGVNAIGDTFDDGEDNDSFSLGAWIYELTHSDEF